MNRQGVITEFGRTWIQTRLEKEDLDQEGKEFFHHLIIEVMPLTDTDIVTTLQINSISKKDLKKIAKLFSELAEEL